MSKSRHGTSDAVTALAPRLRQRRRWSPVGSTSLLLAVGGMLAVATGLLLWLGYQATTAQEHSDRLLADRRAEETLALLIAALDRDMKGAQLSVLQLAARRFFTVGAADLASQSAAAFGRYPYVETIFVWRDQGGSDRLFVLNRADRPPPWDEAATPAVAYPVVARHDHPVIRQLVDHVRADTPNDKRFVAYEMPIASASYQVVAHPVYDAIGTRPALVGIIGYTVNLDWVRQNYFQEIVAQVAAISGQGQSTAIAIADGAGHAVAATAAAAKGGSHERHFPLTFFDSRLTEVADGVHATVWTAAAAPVVESTSLAAVSGRRLFGLMAIASLASLAALVLMARAMQVRAEVAAMKEDFVSTVTHELKTPLSLMRLVADALMSGRYRDPDKLPTYGELLSAEVGRMTHLIDNLLTYARLSSVYDGHASAPIDVAELLAAVAADWQPRLAQQALGLEVSLDRELIISGDRTALQQALNNLIDNAAKYSTPDGERKIGMRATREGRSIVIAVEDRGVGISEADLPLVRERFYRGRGVRTPGSGLGLAIVSRVVANHGGRIDIRNRGGGGTRVAMILPSP